MTVLPLLLNYAWLSRELGPRMIVDALTFYGLHEAPGGVDNPIILGWAMELGLTTYRADSIPWCGLFMAKVARDSAKQYPAAPLWARNWITFGAPSLTAMLGDVLVFARPGGGGHVGLYVGEDTDAYHVLGGNEGDSVNIIRMSRARLVAVRRPLYTVRPANVRVIRLSATGALSTNEN